MDQTRPTSERQPAAGAPPLYGDAAAQSRDRSAEGEGLGSLVADLIGDLQEIVRGEVRLAQAEVREDIRTTVRAAGLLAAGAFLGFVGFVFLMLAVAYVLYEEAELDRWQAAGIVALALLVVGAILALVGKNRLSAANLKPQQTIASLKEDREWAKHQISSVKR
jgi:uncharacterized membrane protein YqjE